MEIKMTERELRVGLLRQKEATIMPSKDKEKIKAYFAGYYERNKIAILEHQREYQEASKSNPHYLELKKATAYRMMTKYPEKYKARYTLRNAVRLGKIRKGCCEVCGSQEVESHHDDYTKPLEVHWFCCQHHCELEGRWIPKTYSERR